MRGILRPVVVALVAVALSGCWEQVGYGPAHRRHNTAETDLTVENATTLTELWSAEVPENVSEPIVSGNRVYVTRTVELPQGGAGARALDSKTGATVWDTSIASLGDNVISVGIPAALSGGELWVGSLHGVTIGSFVRCAAYERRLDPDDGSVVSSGGGRSVSPPVTVGSVVVQTSTGFNDETGFCRGGPLTLTVRDADTLSEHWSAEAPGGTAWGLAPAISLPTVADGRVYVANGSTLSAFALDGCGAATCAPLWSTNLGATVDRWTPVAGESDQVFVMVTGGEIVALAGDSGAELWRASLDSTPFMGPMPLLATDGDTLFVSTAGTGAGANRLLAYDTAGCGAAICEPTWTASPPATLRSGPTLAGGVVYIGGDDGIRGFDAGGCGAPTCDPFVSLPTDRSVMNVTVAQGRLFASGPRHVTAFAPAS